ncbi:hypothetical protein TSAR_003442 [Trichomalopsis sarcophagae]|uniref:Uncharacterized protein n=1 Tax=Trichomalopsis sarcophagae TaxID=543379 RepID=A0A232F9A9_9HYME|nr:hypothetical protein TSAR_003442 [Trichomalopsis sarcophagae]
MTTAGPVNELCGRDLRKHLEEPDRLVKESPMKAADTSAKRPKVDRENDEDDIAALMDELLHIRKGYTSEKINRKQEKCQKERSTDDLLLDYSSTPSEITDDVVKVQRKWDDDNMIFRNCARSEPKKNKAMYMKYHRKFIEKFFK